MGFDFHGHHRICSPTHLIFFSFHFPEEKEKAKINSEELQIKKVKKKKKKKHKEGEKHKRVKMCHRSCQTICAGLLLLPGPLLSTNSSSSELTNRLSLSPFKSPLPVCPLPNDKISHLDSYPHNVSSSMKAAFPTKPCLQSAYPGMAGLEFASFIHIENQPNGGALIAHAYTSQLSSLSADQRRRFAQEFVTLAFSEDTSQVPHAWIWKAPVGFFVASLKLLLKSNFNLKFLVHSEPVVSFEGLCVIV